MTAMWVQGRPGTGSGCSRSTRDWSLFLLLAHVGHATTNSQTSQDMENHKNMSLGKGKHAIMTSKTQASLEEQNILPSRNLI